VASAEDLNAVIDFLRHSSRQTSLCGFLDVRQHPLLLEELILWPIDTEQQLEFSCGVIRHPIGFLAVRSLPA